MKRYVSGTSYGALQSNFGDAARTILGNRSLKRNVKWYADNYPVIYELVPVTEVEIEAIITAAQAAGDEA